MEATDSRGSRGRECLDVQTCVCVYSDDGCVSEV